jgi:hypothetical protein
MPHGPDATFVVQRDGGRGVTGRESTRAAASRLAVAVDVWLASLDAAQRDRATFSFESDERFVWDYRPGTRDGLAIADMTARQREAAHGMLDAALSPRGATEVRSIIALEPILGELERQAGRGTWLRRDPELYWFAVFGEPGGSSPWSWRIGGHHVAVQATVANGQVVGSAPSFLGSNPATVPGGTSAGRRAIDGEEVLGRGLLASLSADQRQIALVDPVAPPDILSGTGHRADVREIPTGIRFDQLEGTQQEHVQGLIRHYLERADADVAVAEWERIRMAGLDGLTFAWAGADQPGRGHYYAIRGPNLLIEYDNTQNGANHIHAVWRDPGNDWGEDLLASHYRDAHAG